MGLSVLVWLEKPQQGNTKLHFLEGFSFNLVLLKVVYFQNSSCSLFQRFSGKFDAAGKLFPDFPAARQAIPAKVWALSGKEMAAGTNEPTKSLENAEKTLI